MTRSTNTAKPESHETPSDERVIAPARELAQRRSGTDEILLLWHPEDNRIELLVHNSESGAGFLIEIAPSNAIDAFYHPYAYASHSESTRSVIKGGTTIVDV
jgi:hypothetical protein